MGPRREWQEETEGCGQGVCDEQGDLRAGYCTSPSKQRSWEQSPRRARCRGVGMRRESAMTAALGPEPRASSLGGSGRDRCRLPKHLQLLRNSRPACPAPPGPACCPFSPPHPAGPMLPSLRSPNVLLSGSASLSDLTLARRVLLQPHNSLPSVFSQMDGQNPAAGNLLQVGDA